jgi:hypothetical protein
MNAKLKRAALPEGVKLRRLLASRAGELAQGAKLVDPDVRGSTGVDLLLADETGRPVFVEIVTGASGDVPTRVFDHMDWLDRNRRLFAKAYADGGVVKAEEPLFVFVAASFPPAAVRAVAAIDDVSVRLVRIESFLIDGEPELLLEEVQQGPRRQGEKPSAGVSAGGDGGAPRGRGAAIQSEEVRSLLSLFRSGVDGLDGRVSEREANGGIAFDLDGRALAFVSMSPVSFTVSPGDRLANPIVVSDRVSLERAMNAVVSLFVREHVGPPDGRREEGEAVGLSEGERAELAAVWGSGLIGGDTG